ncbi:DUF4139 domain-containing protein [Agrobacterium rubi]|nr:DUF4139 domain-containing protein [Agrobacterium rubi]NTF24412.1 DUF4139 domain-containing protein [Agrobacterium rubi]
MKKTILTSAFVGFLMATAAYAGGGPIKSVKISSGGVAEVVRGAVVEADSTIEIEVPLAQVDDILKSLVVFSDNVAVKDMSLAGPQSLQEAFETLPFTTSDMDSLAGILRAMKGSKVSMDGQSDVRTIVGVEEAGKDGVQNLVLLTSSGDMTRARIDAATRIRFVDASAQKKIDDAVALLAAAASDGMRTVRIRLSESSEKEVDLSYVVAAPVWKPTYKLVVQDDGKARLQAWAVLENASGEDWNDVAITLSSGRPVTLKQKLHERFWKNRDEVTTSENDIQPTPYGAMRRQDAELSMQALPAPSVADQGMIAATEQVAETAEALAMATFTLPGRFSVRNGDTLSVPIVDKVIDAAFVSLVDPGRKHPMAALLITNTTGTTLPAGIMTVYDTKGGYVGDARFSDVASGSSRTAIFGTDLKVEQWSERRSSETVSSVKLFDWKLVATKTTTVTGIWKLKAGDESRTVIVEDAIPPGFKIASGQVVEETAGGVRLKAAVKPGETVTLTVRYENEGREETVAADPDIDRIGIWIAGTPSEDVKRHLQDVIDATSDLGRANADLERIRGRHSEIESEQARLRGNLTNVADATLKERWVAKMSVLEDEIDGLAGQRKDLDAEIDALRKRLGEKLRVF